MSQAGGFRTHPRLGTYLFVWSSLLFNLCFVFGKPLWIPIRERNGVKVLKNKQNKQINKRMGAAPEKAKDPIETKCDPVKTDMFKRKILPHPKLVSRSLYMGLQLS